MDTNFNLYKDLINNFHQHDKSNHDQIALLEPLAASMKSGSIQRLLQSWFLIFMEVVLWILVATSILAVIFTDKIYPFSFLNKISFNQLNLETYGEQDFEMLYLGTKALFVIIAILFVVVARMIASIRKKNQVLSLAAKNMKKIGEQLLKEKSNITTLYNKYPYDLPKNQDSIIIGAQPPHDDILL
jgi:hypothetical protein